MGGDCRLGRGDPWMPAQPLPVVPSYPPWATLPGHSGHSSSVAYNSAGYNAILPTSFANALADPVMVRRASSIFREPAWGIGPPGGTGTFELNPTMTQERPVRQRADAGRTTPGNATHL